MTATTMKKGVAILLVVAALLTNVSRAATSTYDINFVSGLVASQMVSSFNETIIESLKGYSYAVTYVSSSIEGAKYSLTVDEKFMPIGSILCDNFIKPNLGSNKEICAIKDVVQGDTTCCTISEFEGHADSCTPNITSQYYFGMYPGLDEIITKKDIDDILFSFDFGGLVMFNSSSLNETHYTLEVTELIDRMVGQGICSSLDSSTTYTPLCFVTSVSDEEIELCKPSETGPCKTSAAGVETEYEIKYPAATELEKEDFDRTINEICSSVHVAFVNITFLNSTIDSKNGTYNFWIREPFKGLFGRGFEQSINKTNYTCVIGYVKSGNTTYYERPEKCKESTRYGFELSIGIPTAFDKDRIDGFFSELMVEHGRGLISFVSSNFSQGLYTMYVEELVFGTLSDAFCPFVTDETIVKRNPELCYITSVIRNNESKCHPSLTDGCNDISLGHNTTYEVKLTNDISSQILTQDEVDAIFLNVIAYVRDASAENIRLVSSEYNRTFYTSVINEPAAGSFGSGFCEYIKTIEEKCLFEYVRAEGAEYCNRSIDCPAINYYTLTFVDGNKSLREEHRYGDIIDHPGWKKEGYLLTWDNSSKTMPQHDLVLTAVWVPGTKYVEIVFSVKSLKEGDVEQLVSNYTNKTFEVEIVESAESSGEAKIIVIFIDKEDAINFVEAIMNSDGSNSHIKGVEFIDTPPQSFSILTNPLSALVMLAF